MHIGVDHGKIESETPKTRLQEKFDETSKRIFEYR
jgi:hypothetical protein